MLPSPPGALGAFPGQWLPNALLEENPRGEGGDAPAAMGDGSFIWARDAREVPKVRPARPSPNDACFRVTARARPSTTLPARRNLESSPGRASGGAPRGQTRCRTCSEKVAERVSERPFGSGCRSHVAVTARVRES